MFKEGDIVVYRLPQYNVVSACIYDPSQRWKWQRPTMKEIDGITALVEFTEYTSHYPSGWGCICSGNYEIAVSCNDITHYSGYVNPQLLKRNW